jgi:acyl-CoA reductase-like NAD-dependent aldehyde dehydrogenase
VSPRDQLFSDRASAFWGHHRLPIEQLAGIPSQGQLSLKLSDASMSRGEFVGLHTRDTLDDSRVDQRLALPPEQCRLADTGLGGHRSHRLTILVLDTDDLDHAVAQALAGRMENTGQACNGTKRVVVLDKHYDEFAEKFAAAVAGQSYDAGDYGPLSSAKATQTLVDQVGLAVRQGATVLVGSNEPRGNVYTPTVLTGIGADNDVYREELFGPVAQLYRVADDDEAIALTNASPYGLGAIVICDDVKRAERVGDQLDVGMVFVNQAGLEGADVPFGGVKRSGYGRELGRFGIEEFSNKKLFRFAGGAQS